MRLENECAMAKSEKKRVSTQEKSNFKLPLRCGHPNASTEVVHRPRSQSPLHFDIRNILIGVAFIFFPVALLEALCAMANSHGKTMF